jgi:phosphonate transport system substrate-binding protein
MRSIFFWMIFLLLPCPLQARTIVFAPLPMESRETVLKQFMPLAFYLKQTLGHEVQFDYSDNYAQILDKFRQGKVDLAYLGPLPYVSLRSIDEHAVPLVHFNEASGKPLYTCSIVALADADFTLANIAKRKVALTQPLSTCGFLSTNGLLRKQGSSLAGNLYRYLSKHDEVAMAVVRGEFDIGGLKTAIAEKYGHLGLVVLARTSALPSFALIGNGATLSAEEQGAIRDALTRLDPAGRDKALLESWGANIRHGAVPARDGDYAPVRELLGDTLIPETGNF